MGSSKHSIASASSPPPGNSTPQIWMVENHARRQATATVTAVAPTNGQQTRFNSSIGLTSNSDAHNNTTAAAGEVVRPAAAAIATTAPICKLPSMGQSGCAKKRYKLSVV